ncbi:MAG: hypothetical protein ACI8UO_001133 [Verrucomicrobiales bacterium]
MIKISISPIKLILVLSVLAQQVLVAQRPEPKVNASLDETRIAAGLETVLKITVEGGSPAVIPESIEAPGLTITLIRDRRDLDIVNGVRINRVTILYEVVGTELGTYKIPGVPFEIYSKSYTTQPLEIEIVEASRTQEVTADKPFFMTFTADKEEAYINEAIRVVCKVYARGADSLGNPNIPKVENADKFVIEPFPHTYRITPEQIQTLPYSTTRFPTTIYGLAEGDFDLGPVVITAQISPFTGGGSQPFQKWPTRRAITGPPLKLKIKSLPQAGRPANFFGAVGQFTLEVETKDLDVKIGDPISVDIKITGASNNLVPPAIPETQGWRAYEANRVESAPDEEATEPVNIFNQVVIPMDQHTELPQIQFSFFDPQQGKYVTLLSNRIPLKVARDPEAGQQTRDLTRIGLPEEQLKDILQIRTGSTGWTPMTASIWSRPGFWFVGIIPLLAFLALVGIGGWRRLSVFLEKRRTGDLLDFDQIKEKLGHDRVSRGLFYKLVLEYFYRWRGQNEQLLTKISPDSRNILEKLSETGHTFLYAGEAGESEPVGPNEKKAAIKALSELDEATQTSA